MAQIKTYNVLLDTKESVTNPAFTINTNDLKTVKLVIRINQDGDPLDLTGATVRLAIKKPDRTTVLQDCTIVTPATDGSCEIVLSTQAYVVKGDYEAEVMVYFGTDTVAVTSDFRYTAKKGILSDDTVESTNEWQSITQAIADTEAILVDLRTNGTGVDAQARADIATHTTQLAKKAAKDEIFTMANMGQDIKTAMTGGSVAVVGRDAVIEENVVDKQITPRKSSFIELPSNYDWWEKKNIYLAGKSCFSSGQIYDNASFDMYVIPVEPNTTYKFSYRNYLDSNDLQAKTIRMEKIAFSAVGNATTQITLIGSILSSQTAHFTTPDGCKYIYVVIEKIINYINYVSLQKGQTPSYPIGSMSLQSVEIPYLDQEIENIKELLEAPNVNITAWGDSLTYGAGGTSSPYPAVVATLSGKTVTNYGVGGETSATIMGRQGSMPMIVKPSITIPAGLTPVEVTLVASNGDFVAPLLQSAASEKGINPCSIDGIEGTLSYNTTDLKYYFTRLVSGTATTINRPTPLVTYAMKERKNDGTLLLWIGHNDIGTNTNDATFHQKLVDYYKLMLEYSGCKKFIILSMVEGNESKWSALNYKMSNVFGRHFINIHNYLVNYGLSDAGLTPTTQDTTDMTNGRVPVSLRSDGLHLNESGYTIVGQQVYKRGQELGFW